MLLRLWIYSIQKKIKLNLSMQSIAQRICEQRATKIFILHTSYQLNTEFTFTFWFVYLSWPWVFPILILDSSYKFSKIEWMKVCLYLKWWKNFDRKSKTFFKTCNVIFFEGLTTTTYHTSNFKSKIYCLQLRCAEALL